MQNPSNKESMGPVIAHWWPQTKGRRASPRWRRQDAQSASPKSWQLLPISIRGFRVVIQLNEADHQSEQTSPWCIYKATGKVFSICIFHHAPRCDCRWPITDIDASGSECFLLLPRPVRLSTGLAREIMGLHLMVYPTVPTGGVQRFEVTNKRWNNQWPDSQTCRHC